MTGKICKGTKWKDTNPTPCGFKAIRGDYCKRHLPILEYVKQLEAKLEIAKEGLEFYAKDAWVSIATFPAPNRVDWSKAPINDDYGTKAKQTLSKINEGL